MGIIILFVDTNLFVRSVVNDNKEQSAKAAKLFKDAVFGKVTLKSSVIVFFEIFWVLRNRYGLEKGALKEVLLNVLNLKVSFVGKKVFRKAVQEMDKFNYDLEDAFNFYTAKELEVNDFVTFDKKLQKKW